MLEFRVLGPVEVYSAGALIDPGPPRQRTVLAALALDAGRPVLAEALIDRVWGEVVPERARHSLHVYVARLRGLLASADHRDGAAPRLFRRSGGYVLDVEPGTVDAHRFRHLFERTRNPGCTVGERSLLLREALSLWRGALLADLSGPWVEAVRTGWHRQRVEATLAWARCELRLGRPDVVILPLLDAVAENPLVEPLAAELVRALHLAGRTADALDRFAAIERHLTDQIGVGPGTELRQAYQEICGDAAASAPGGTSTGDRQPARPAATVPRQLPLDVPGFAGRDADLAWLDRLLARADGQSPAVLVAVIAGLPGVGKTALAIRWAHQIADRFPDGQVFLNLRGYDPDRPLTAAEALARLLDALGFGEADIPPELEQRAARYRTEIAGRRILLVLDNAASAQQVRPLLPGSPTCAAVVTSRDGLAGLVARDGAHRLDLGPLPDDDARALLRRLIGHRADAEPDAVATLANQCGRLPLALRLAAEMAVSRPAIALAHLVAELADQDRPLRPLLDGGGGDPWAAVSTVFSWSVRHLPPGPALLFRRLGLHPGPDLDAHAAAALAGSDVAAARRALDALAHAHLVDRVGTDRFGRHDLLRAYAVELAAADPDTAGRTAALDRQYGYYLAAAAAAMQRLHPAEAHLRPQPAAVTTALPELADADAARAWLDAERPVLVALAGKAATGEQPGFAVLVSATLHRYLDGGYHTDALAIHEHARAAARRVGDSGGEAQAELGLGIVAYRLGRLPAAIDRLRPALAVFDRIGDLMGQARALSVLGTIAQRQGRYRSATDHHEHALELFRRLDDRAGEARALNNLGLVERLAGRFELATEHHRRALDLFRRAGHRTGEAIALNSLGLAEQQLGRYSLAAEHLHAALTIFGDLGDRSGEASALDNLGTMCLRMSRNTAAVEYFARALAIFRATGERIGQARAYTGLGHSHCARGERELARRCYLRALAGYADAESPDAGLVRARLAALDSLAVDAAM